MTDIMADEPLRELLMEQVKSLRLLERGFCPPRESIETVASILPDKEISVLDQQAREILSEDCLSMCERQRVLLSTLAQCPANPYTLKLRERVSWYPETRRMVAYQRKKIDLAPLQELIKSRVLSLKEPDPVAEPEKKGQACRPSDASTVVSVTKSAYTLQDERQVAAKISRMFLAAASSSCRDHCRKLRAAYAFCPPAVFATRRWRPVNIAYDRVVMREIVRHAEELKECWQEEKRVCDVLASEAVKFCSSIMSRRQAEEHRQQRDRLKLLKDNNLEEYMAMVKRTKNKRLQELLDQTDKFLNEMGARVETQKGTAKRMRFEKGATASGSDQPVTEVASNNGPDPSTGSDDAEGNQENGAPSEQQGGTKGVSRDVYYSVSHKIHESVTQPTCMDGGALRPFQLTGLEWMISLYNNDLHGILADEMGLGKTVQTISLFAYLYEFKSNPGPHLVVAPLSTIPNWENEFERWCPTLRVVAFKGSKDERFEAKQALKTGQFNVCLTTPEYIIREKYTLSRRRWRHIVVDEGHRMKNLRSKFHVALNEFTSSHRLLLTGTPLQNNLAELWALLNFLLPRVFAATDDFEKWFNEPFSQLPSQEQEAALTEEEQLLIINRLHSVLRPFLLRRVKKDVLHDLPEKKEHVIRVELSEWQKLVYKQIESKAMKTVDQRSGKVTNKALQNHLMQLRKIVNHPYLFLDDGYYLDEQLYRVSGKFEVLDRIIPKLLHFDHKMLIFCQMTKLMDILGDYLEWKGVPFLRLDGAIGVDERRDRMAEFNSDETEKKIFILSTRAGGLGLNLQAADTVILFDSDFNPQQDLQAQNRAHRVGQKKEVVVFRLITQSPVEELVLSKAQYKLDIDEKIIQAGMFDTESTEDERHVKLKALLEGKDLESQKDVTTHPCELNKMLARTEDELHWFEDYDDALIPREARRSSEKMSNGAAKSEPLIKAIAKEVEKVSPLRTRRASRRKERTILPCIEETPAPPVNSALSPGQHSAWLETSQEAVGLLVKSRRLMSASELPDWLLAEDEEAEENAANLLPAQRRSRGQHVANLDNLTDLQYMKMIEKIESGEAANIDEAFEQSGKKRKRRRKLAASEDSQREDEGEEGKKSSAVVKRRRRGRALASDDEDMDGDAARSDSAAVAESEVGDAAAAEPRVRRSQRTRSRRRGTMQGLDAEIESAPFDAGEADTLDENLEPFDGCSGDGSASRREDTAKASVSDDGSS